MAKDEELVRSNRKLVKKLTIVVFAMFGFGFALVPMYNLVCDAFGINGRFLDIEQGTYGVKEGESKGRKLAARKDLDRTVTVQFTTTLNQNLDWEFRPMTQSMQLHPGEIKRVKYYARNKTGKTVVAQAVPSLAPGQAVKYFTKMECFCFSQQTFKPGEAKEMPLVFVVDPDLPQDISTITLGYTFFDTEKKAAVEHHQTVEIAAADINTIYLD